MLVHIHSTSTRPLTTAHLAQTMSLLELTAGELRQKIESELAANPALELGDLHRCPLCQRPLANPGRCPACSQPPASADEPIVFVSPRVDFSRPIPYYDPDQSGDDDWAAAREELPAYILRQVARDLTEADRPIAAHILTSLDEDGLLRIPLLEIARYHHVSLAQIQRVLHLIQRADPVGVGSPSPREALLVQLEVLAETRQIPPLAVRLVSEGMDLLSRRSYHELSRLLKITPEQTLQLARFVSDNLNPYPARAHWGETYESSNSGSVYRDPDIILSLLNSTPESSLVVEIASPYAGALHINPMFREALSQAPDDKAESWQAHLDRASLLVKCIQQRNYTLVRLVRRLVTLQREFILHGDQHLKPITRATLAKELDVHESTVSRAVSDKAIQMPNGHILPLSRLFDRSLNVRTVLRQIVEQESEPLSDNQLVDLLNQQGFCVARRTVAKYRSIEGILPARMRQPAPKPAIQVQ
jgi:RNA polymerase sigma-54 factor